METIITWVSIFIIAIYFAYKWGIKSGKKTTTSDDLSSSELLIDRDNWEGSFYDATNPLPVKARISFSYLDGANKETHRIVDVREFDSALHSGILIGHCNLRNATRTFRFQGMSEILDIDTGEIINNINEFLQKRYDESPDASMRKLLENAYDALRAMLYIGKADGRLTIKEKKEILEFCHFFTGDTRIDIEILSKSLGFIEIPSLQGFKLCCGRLAQRDEDFRQKIIEVADRVIATDKTIHPAEQDAVDYLRKRLSSVQTIIDSSS